MLKLLLVSAVGIGAAVLLGYVGAAVIATELGRASLAALAVLIGVAAVAESARMFGPLGRA